MDAPQTTRDLLLEQLSGRNAHVSFSEAVDGLSARQAGQQPQGLPHTIWDLIEHIRIAQQDIISFSRDASYEAPEWPDDYWPDSHAPENADALQRSIRLVEEGLETMRAMVRDPDNDLQVPFAHGSGQTLFREAMLIVDHNAYHIGQIIQIRRLLGSW